VSRSLLRIAATRFSIILAGWHASRDSLSASRKFDGASFCA